MVLQLQLHQLGTVVAAVEDGEVAVGALGAQVLGEDFQCHPLALGLFVARADHADLVAMAHFRPQLLLEHVGLLAMRMLAREDAAGGAVVLLQHYHLQGRIVLLQQH